MISAIIVNYFSSQMTGRAVKSLFHDPEETEVFVVDNSADPVERERLESLLEGQPVRLLINENNAGFGQACNRACSLSQGEFLFLLNPDAYILPGALTRLRDFLSATPSAGAAGPRIYWDDEKTFLLPPSVLPSAAGELCGQLRRLSSFACVVSSLLHRAQAVRVWTAQSPVRQKALSGGHVLLRRSAVDRAGGLFDDRFFLYYEDSDLMLRLQRSGYRLFVVPGAAVVHNYVHAMAKIDAMAAARAHYFEKNSNGALSMKAAEFLSGIPARARSEAFTDLGGLTVPPSLQVPRRIERSWLLEWSPSPHFIPAAGCFGTGPVAAFPDALWELLGPGAYYCRISASDIVALPAARWRWRKDPVLPQR